MAALVSKVVIVGGGTAGWLAALHIKGALGPNSIVTLVESPDVGAIGVGEGTQPIFRTHLLNLKIDEDDCLRSCGATFKNGIRFAGWRGKDEPAEYFHPFFSGQTGETTTPFTREQLWVALVLRGLAAEDSYADSCFAETELMRKHRAPYVVNAGTGQRQAVANYAYHIDATGLGEYLRSIAIGRGVVHRQAHVADVRRNERGDVASLITREQGEIAGEFFIDCTGFRRLVISKLADEFVDFGQWLLNDRAIAARVPYATDKTRPLPSRTDATAGRYGWFWQVPLANRLGTGYVYSSAFVDDASAEQEFAQFLGIEPELTQRISFRTGMYRGSWQHNCVAIGLSSGFIEPLEATGIALISHSLFRLLEHWPDTRFDPKLRDRFNHNLAASYEHIRDFIVLHYCLSNRNDTPYWQAVQRPETVPDSVRDKLQQYRDRWPFGGVLESSGGYNFPFMSIAAILAGFGWLPENSNPYVAGLSDRQLLALFQESTSASRHTASRCEDHAGYLKRITNQ